MRTRVLPYIALVIMLVLLGLLTTLLVLRLTESKDDETMVPVVRVTDLSPFEGQLETSHPIYIRIDDDDVWRLYYQDPMQVTMTDGLQFWGFDNEFSITVRRNSSATYNAVATITTSGKTRTYDFGTVKVTMDWSKCPESEYHYVPDTATVYGLNLTLSPNYQLAELPGYFSMRNDMWVNENGLYVPKGNDKYSVIKQYTGLSASLFGSGSDYITTYIVDGMYDALESYFVSCVATTRTNAYSNVIWYKDDDIVFLHGPRGYLLAKKLRMNTWCVYRCSESYIDYALTGVMNIWDESTNQVD